MSAPQPSRTEPAAVAGSLTRPEPTGAENVATHVQEAWNRWQRSRAEEKGHVPTVMAFTGYGTTSWVRVLSRVVLAKDEDFLNGRRLAKVVADGVHGWRNFVSPPLAYAEATLQVGDLTTKVRADRMGVIDVKVDVELEPGWRTATLIVGDEEPVTMDLYISSPEAKVGLVSDIDDTVVVTSLPRPLLAAWNSFVIDEHARTPTPGMAVLLRRIAESDPMAPVIYISTGAWNVAQTLTRFLGRNLYPLGALLLTSWGPTKDRWFRSGMEHKVRQLERLAQEFPDLQWILVGDDGQHDPEIYADFAQRHPDRVKAIVIRQLTPSEALLAGGRAEGTRRSTPGIPWCYGPDGASLSNQLEDLGLLPVEFVDVHPNGWLADILGEDEGAEHGEGTPVAARGAGQEDASDLDVSAQD